MRTNLALASNCGCMRACNVRGTNPGAGRNATWQLFVEAHDAILFLRAREAAPTSGVSGRRPNRRSWPRPHTHAHLRHAHQWEIGNLCASNHFSTHARQRFTFSYIRFFFLLFNSTDSSTSICPFLVARPVAWNWVSSWWARKHLRGTTSLKFENFDFFFLRFFNSPAGAFRLETKNIILPGQKPSDF